MTTMLGLAELAALGALVYLVLRFDRASSRPRTDRPEEAPDATPICPHCCLPVEEDRNFCPSCLTPLTVYAATGPIERVLAQGEMFRRAVAHPTRLALVGLWGLTLGPAVLAVVPVVVGSSRQAEVAIPTAVTAAVFGAILARATRRYAALQAGRERSP